MAWQSSSRLSLLQDFMNALSFSLFDIGLGRLVGGSPGGSLASTRGGGKGSSGGGPAGKGGGGGGVGGKGGKIGTSLGGKGGGKGTSIGCSPASPKSGSAS